MPKQTNKNTYLTVKKNEEKIDNRLAFGPEPDTKVRMLDFEYFFNMSVKDKKVIFSQMKLNEYKGKDMFLPRYGITAGKFCYYQVITDTKKSDNQNEQEEEEEYHQQDSITPSQIKVM